MNFKVEFEIQKKLGQSKKFANNIGRAKLDVANKDHNTQKTFGVVGTPDYMPPEVLGQTKIIPAAVDWWALGCIIYEFIFGFPPFNSDSVN